MPQRHLLLLSSVFLAASYISAADPTPEPARAEDVRFLDNAGRRLPLEHANVATVPASPGFAATWEIKGARSSMRIKREPAMLFLARLPEGGSPNQFHLFRLNAGTARKPYASSESWRTVTLSVTRAGDSYGLAPVGELTEGEYAFIRAGSNQAYCFGVDPAN
jgi:hypothetical protein